jgi:hypothetical protein
VLAVRTALVVWGIWRRWGQPLEVVIPTDRRPSGLIAHHSRTLEKRDVSLVNGLRVTSTARTLLDTAPWLNEKQRTRAVNDLRLRGLLTLPALHDVIERNPTHRGVTLLRPLLEIAQTEPTRSHLEDAFLSMVRRYRHASSQCAYLRPPCRRVLPAAEADRRAGRLGDTQIPYSVPRRPPQRR